MRGRGRRGEEEEGKGEEGGGVSTGEPNSLQTVNALHQNYEKAISI